MKKGISYLLVGVLSAWLSGCSMTELEERCFPVVVTVGYEDENVSFCEGFPKTASATNEDSSSVQIGVSMVLSKDFEQAKEKYEKRLNKEADYNHLKVLVLEKDLLEQPEPYKNMLDYMAQTEEFPRNTYVCVMEDIEDLWEIEKELSQDLGSYLEEYLKKHEEKKEKLLTLGDLIDEKENQLMVLYMPYLDAEENYVEWRGYMNTDGKSWQESK